MPQFSFKHMSDFKLTNIRKVKSDFILSKFLPINDELIFSVIQKLDTKDYECYKYFPSGS